MVNVERLKRIYPMGTRVRLIHMNDPCRNVWNST